MALLHFWCRISPFEGQMNIFGRQDILFGANLAFSGVNSAFSGVDYVFFRFQALLEQA